MPLSLVCSGLRSSNAPRAKSCSSMSSREERWPWIQFSHQDLGFVRAARACGRQAPTLVSFRTTGIVSFCSRHTRPHLVSRSLSHTRTSHIPLQEREDNPILMAAQLFDWPLAGGTLRRGFFSRMGKNEWALGMNS